MDVLGVRDIVAALFLSAGFLATINFLAKATSFSLIYLRRSKLYRYRHTTAGNEPWAIVTGSTAGIGKAFAHELASSGFNVVLHGRNSVKLAKVLGELTGAFPERSFKAVISNASKCGTDDGGVDELVAELQGLNLTVLVNNAGGGPVPSFGMLSDYTEREIIDNVNLNAVFPVVLLSKLLPVLVRNAPSLVINMGSMTDNGLPLMSFYNASKAFISMLAQTLARDMVLGGHEIEVLCLRTGGVTGSSHVQVQPDFFNPDTRTFARAALGRVGCGRAVVVGYFPHALQQLMADMMPAKVREKVFIHVMNRRREDEIKRMKNH